VWPLSQREALSSTTGPLQAAEDNRMHRNAIASGSLPATGSEGTLQTTDSRYTWFHAPAVPAVLAESCKTALDANEATLLDHFIAAKKSSQMGQDLWALSHAGCKKNRGYYVDIGSNSGEFISNTHLMDRVFGWGGLCVDAFPCEMKSRTCSVAVAVVTNETGVEVEFAHRGNASIMSGCDIMGGVVGEDAADGNHANTLPGQQMYTFNTSTMTQLLRQHSSPSVVDYLSLDVEGAEVLALQGLDHLQYCFKLIDVEHNFEEPKRSDIRLLLESRNYTYAGADEQDDFYTHPCAK